MSRHRHFLNVVAPCNLFIKINQPLDLNPAALSEVLASFHSSDTDMKYVYMACADTNVRFYAALVIIARSVSRSESRVLAMIGSVLSSMLGSLYVALKEDFN